MATPTAPGIAAKPGRATHQTCQTTAEPMIDAAMQSFIPSAVLLGL